MMGTVFFLREYHDSTMKKTTQFGKDNVQIATFIAICSTYPCYFEIRRRKFFIITH